MAKKGLKVTNLCRDKKIGVAAESLNEFLQKSCDKLMVKDKWQACKCHLAEDGTLVDDDDYFRTLPAQTLLVVVLPEETMKTDFEYQYEIIQSTIHQYLQAGHRSQEFFSQNPKKLQKLHEYVMEVGANEKKVKTSDKDSDPQWFKGIKTNDKTKEAIMSKNAKDRMKKYFYKVKDLLTKSDIYNSRNGVKTETNLFLKALQKMLELNGYNGKYFDRNSNESDRLCNKDGLFECGGLWNQERCNHSDSHFINPYRSREDRIIFQTWNLDHRIELSRSIIPCVLSALKHMHEAMRVECCSCGRGADAGHVSANWYYKEIFTTENLKLVHIVCHDKTTHDVTSDSYIVCNRCWNGEGSN